MQPPNLENLTLPGGIILNFDIGAGMRDLGEIVPDSLEIDPKSTEYTFESQRSGKLRPAKVFSIKEEVNMKFKLVEPVIDNLRPFLKGGNITVVGGGTDTVTGQEVTLTGEQLISLGKYGVSAVTVTNLAGDTTYARNLDYVIDPGQVGGGLIVARLGRIAGGSITDGQQVKVDYTYTTWESLKFPVATAEFQQGAARLDFSPSVGLSGKYHIPKCQLKPDGAISFNPSKELQLGMILEVLDDYVNHPDAPFGEWESPNES
jgi:hypothetical protein